MKPFTYCSLSVSAWLQLLRKVREPLVSAWVDHLASPLRRTRYYTKSSITSQVLFKWPSRIDLAPFAWGGGVYSAMRLELDHVKLLELQMCGQMQTTGIDETSGALLGSAYSHFVTSCTSF